MPSLNVPVQRLKVAILPLDVPCSGPVTHSEEILTLNIPSGVPPGPQTVIFCDPVVTITTDVLLIFVCVRHQLKINIM
jgi:hypothetical protein